VTGLSIVSRTVRTLWWRPPIVDVFWGWSFPPATSLNSFVGPVTTIDDLKLARDIAVPITVHVGVPGPQSGGIAKLNEAKLLGPDITYVHTLRDSEEELQIMADTGGTISTSPATEMMSGHGFASVQRWARHGLKPSISIDNETRMPTDLFTQMRALHMSDRMQEIARAGKEGDKPTIVSVRELIEFATLQGAKTLGLESKTGSLTPGKWADVIIINLNDINTHPSNDRVAVSRTHCEFTQCELGLRRREG
jgi:5-methylthioadenosine/S-adenosylhomocysteine deaminase